jgi:hypothetical protein
MHAKEELRVGQEQERARFAHKMVRVAQTATGLSSRRCMLGKQECAQDGVLWTAIGVF